MRYFQKLLRPRLLVIAHDFTMIAVAWIGAYWLRYNLGNMPLHHLFSALHLLPIILTLQMAMAGFMGLYRGIWRYASVPDLIRIIKVVVAGGLLAFSVYYLAGFSHVIPRSVLPLYTLLLISLWGGSRFLYRWLKERHVSSQDAKRVLIIGAGRAGESLVRDLLRQTPRRLKPVAFLDDNLNRRGHEIHGIRVVGDTHDIQEVVKHYHVSLMIIAIPSISSFNMRRIVAQCERAGIPYRTLPSLHDLAMGRVSIQSLREVSIEDLLGRDSVHMDAQITRNSIEGKIVLVTGAGGSIGSELSRQIALLHPHTLIILDHSEYNLYTIDQELRENFPTITLESWLMDVSDEPLMEFLFRQKPPDIIFHAAAYKHVPLLEPQILTAVKNNIIGTQTLADMANRYHVKTFVLVSTDKVVKPTSLMGMTKRVAELYCQSLNTRAKTHFITVRFGNVLDSAGSVVPLFKKQLAAGGPLTVTHPDITRYFMTIKEAVSLILQASSMGQGGEIYVLDMGEPIKIQYLAEQMIQLAGLKLGKDIQVQYIGLRPGEKLHEELFYESETPQKTANQKIFLTHSQPKAWPQVEIALLAIRKAYQTGDVSTLYHWVGVLVPEYSSVSFASLHAVREDIT